MLSKEQGDARRAIGRLVAWGFFTFSPEGLSVDRDPVRRPDELDIDTLLERFELCGVPSDEIVIEARVRPEPAGPHAFFRLIVRRPGVEHLATFIASLREGLADLDASSPRSDEPPVVTA